MSILRYVKITYYDLKSVKSKTNVLNNCTITLTMKWHEYIKNTELFNYLKKFGAK